MNLFLKFRLSILAGISISLACTVFLSVGSIAGAVLFAFGLLTCVYFKLPLYTGTAGFTYSLKDMAHLIVILLGNIFGCYLTASILTYALPSITEAVLPIILKRESIDIIQSLILSICCGFIMTVAVKFARDGQFLPLIFGVPLFILCGFIHSIADAFYLTLNYCHNLTSTLLINYPIAIIGNFIGCNLYRILAFNKEYMV